MNCLAKTRPQSRAVRTAAWIKWCAVGVLFSHCLLRNNLVKAEEASDKLPRILMANPLAALPGKTTKIVLRGFQLEGVTEVKLSGGTAELKLLKAEKAGVPNKQEAKYVGDTQVEIELTLPESAAAGSLRLQPVSPAGTGKEYELLLGSASPAVQEKEPNQGFSTAQQVTSSQTIDGQIDNNQDVDVFALEATAGQTLIAELIAAPRGSAMDGALTLFDAAGHPLLQVDDVADSRDPRFEFKLPATGRYYLALQDGLEQGGPTHPYRLTVRLAGE